MTQKQMEYADIVCSNFVKRGGLKMEQEKTGRKKVQIYNGNADGKTGMWHLKHVDCNCECDEDAYCEEPCSYNDNNKENLVKFAKAMDYIVVKNEEG